jgi:hypothetical protein
LRYQFFLADEAVSIFAGSSQRERLALYGYFRHLSEFPESYDCTWEFGGFDFCAKRFGHWSITYRIDGAVKHVLIMAVDKLSLR